jgi:hypothetical protein
MDGSDCCAAHAGRVRGRDMTPAERRAAYAQPRNKGISARQSCRCVAYPWPHRLGGGICRGDAPPAGTPKRYLSRDRHRHGPTLRRLRKAWGL